MEGYVRAQAVIFGDFSGYDVNSKSIFDLMNDFKEFEVIPNVIDEVQLEIRENIPTQRIVKRIQLNSYKNKIMINILEDNISIHAMPEINDHEGKSNININEFIKDTKIIFKILSKIINNKANRISLITTYLNDSDIKKQYDKYIKPDGFFKDKDVFEWNSRSVVRENLDINGAQEEINIVCNIYKANGVISSILHTPTNFKFDGVLTEIDINTIPEKIEFRIDDKFIDTFYDTAILRKNSIEESIKNE